MYSFKPKVLLPQHNGADLPRQMFTVPELIIVNVARPVNQLCCMFEYSIEFILDAMVEAVSDKINVYNNLYGLSTRLSNMLYQLPVYAQNSHLDRMITLEQSALDMLDYFSENKMYLYGRYLPYRFETLMDNGVLLLKRHDDFDEFCEKIAIHLGFYEGE